MALLRKTFFTSGLILLALQCFSQFDAGPNDSINPGVPVTLTATYGDVGIGVNTDDDRIEGPFPIGFNFSFFGAVYTQFYIGANGWISFSPNPVANGTRQAFAVPNNAFGNPVNCILGPWQDLLPKPAGGPYIYYLTIGTAPNRQLVVMWCQTPMYSCITETETFQIVLFEGSNVIENHITNKPYCDWLGNLATLGVQNSTGFIGYAVPGRNATSWTASQEGWRYTPTSADSFQIASIPYNLKPILPGDKVFYSWYNGTEQIGSSQSITVSPNQTATYRAWITLCDGQQFTDSVTVVVIPYIPNAFTPNADGLNDKFRILGLPVENITKYNMIIYDRWGQTVFSTTDILDSWDGKFRGEVCPAGEYVWVIWYEDNKKTKFTNKGLIMLVR
jgi:gliding motility-associated-like protein